MTVFGYDPVCLVRYVLFGCLAASAVGAMIDANNDALVMTSGIGGGVVALAVKVLFVGRGH